MEILKQILKEIEELKDYHENKAAELCENSNLPCEYNLCDIEDAKSDALKSVIKKVGDEAEKLEKKELTAEKRSENDYLKAQHMIYYELPVLISKIFHAAFANCECGTPVIEKEDMQFIKGFIEATENTFKIAMEGQKKQIAEMLKMHEK